MVCRALVLALQCSAVVCAPTSAHVQPAPSASEIAAYTGLHAAAHRDDRDGVRALIAAKADLEARDGHARTAAHVAAHRGHGEILRLLAALHHRCRPICSDGNADGASLPPVP